MNKPRETKSSGIEVQSLTEKVERLLEVEAQHREVKGIFKEMKKPTVITEKDLLARVH